MYNVIIWGTGDCYRRCYNSLKYQELIGQVKVLAVTSNEKDTSTTIDGYPFLSKEEAFTLDYDYCLVAIDKMTSIYEEVRRGGVD